MALLGEKSELIAKIFFAPQAGAAKSHAWTSFSPVARVGPENFSRYARMIGALLKCLGLYLSVWRQFPSQLVKSCKCSFLPPGVGHSRVTDVPTVTGRPVCSLNILFHHFSCHILVILFGPRRRRRNFYWILSAHTPTPRAPHSHVRAARLCACAMGP